MSQKSFLLTLVTFMLAIPVFQVGQVSANASTSVPKAISGYWKSGPYAMKFKGRKVTYIMRVPRADRGKKERGTVVKVKWWHDKTNHAYLYREFYRGHGSYYPMRLYDVSPNQFHFQKATHPGHSVFHRISHAQYRHYFKHWLGTATK